MALFVGEGYGGSLFGPEGNRLDGADITDSDGLAQPRVGKDMALNGGEGEEKARPDG